MESNNQLELSKHRKQTVNEILDLLKSNDKVACVRYTGYGKSYFIVSSLIDKLNSKVLIIVPNTALQLQYYQMFNKNTNIKVITYQIIKEKSDEYISKHYSNAKYIICDECHHIGNNKWRKELDRLNKIVKAKIIGLTATPLRGDNVEVVNSYFNNIQVEPMELIDGISAGFIPKIKYIVAYADIENINNYKLSELDRYSIDKLLNVPKILEKYIDKDRLNKNLKILVFVPQVKYIKESMIQCMSWFSNIYPNKEINIYTVNSSLTKIQNEDMLYKFGEEHSNNTIDIMVSVDMLVEGLHLPTISVEIMLRKTKSPVTYFQQIGRVINSDQPIVFDLINNSKHIYYIGKEYKLNKELFESSVRRKKVMFEDCIELYDETKDITTILQKYAYFRTYIKVPKELKEQIIKEDKLTYRQIAKKYDIAESTIAKIFKEYNITRNKYNTNKGKIEVEKIFNDNIDYIKSCIGIKSRRQVAEDIGMNESNLVTLLKRNNIKWKRLYSTVKKDQQIKEKFVDLINNKYSPKEIKEKLSLTDKEYEAYLRDEYVRANRIGIKRVMNDWKVSSLKYIEENANKVSIKKLAEKTGLNEKAISSYIKENNLKTCYVSKKPTVITEELESKVLDLYNKIGSLYGVHKELGIHKNTVKKIVLKHGLKVKESNKPKGNTITIVFK